MQVRRVVVATRGNLDILSCGHEVAPVGLALRACPVCSPPARKLRLTDLLAEDAPSDPRLPAEFGRV